MIVDASHPWITANPKETDLSAIRVGQNVKIEIDAFSGRVLSGRVASLSPGTGAEFALLPAQNASGNWVKIVQRVPIRIEFDEAVRVDALRSGMSASVEIDTGRSRSLASLFGVHAADAATLP